MKNIAFPIQRSLLTAIFLVSIFVIGCQKPETDIGLELQDGLLSTQADTTLAITTSLIRVDSLKTDSLSYNLCGNLFDPVFGNNSASLAFNLSLSTSEVDFGIVEDLVIDSMVLTMRYSDYTYGKTIPQKFSVREIASEFHRDSTYYSNHEMELGDIEYILDADESYDIELGSDVIVNGQIWDPQLRLFLDPALGDYFLENYNDETWTDKETFAEFFTGLHIESTTEAAAIIGYDVKDFDSRITMYYRDTVEEDTLEYIFFIDESDVALSLIDNEYGIDLSSLNVNMEVEALDKLYVKSGSGVEIKLSIPDLTEMYMDGESINKAEIVIPVDGYNIKRFPVPFGLVLVNKDEEDVVEFINDETAFADYDSEAGEYRFNISLYLQKVLSGQLENRDLYVVPLSSGITVNRVVLNGPAYNLDNITDNLRLEITFTK